MLKLSLIGACASCPSSVITLKSGVENMMKEGANIFTDIFYVNGNFNAMFILKLKLRF